MSKICAGQKVVCIDGKFHPAVWEWTDVLPIEGEIYTVAKTQLNPHGVTGIVGYGVRLQEIRGITIGEREVFWTIERFRPLEEHKTECQAKGHSSIPTPGPICLS